MYVQSLLATDSTQAWAEDNEELQDALEIYQDVHSVTDSFPIWICTFAQ